MTVTGAFDFKFNFQIHHSKFVFCTLEKKPEFYGKILPVRRRSRPGLETNSIFRVNHLREIMIVGIAGPGSGKQEFSFSVR